MLWHLYNDYFKESIKTNKYVKFLRWYVWVIFLAFICIDVGLYITFILYDVLWVQLVMLLVATGAGFYFGNEVRKVVRKKVGTIENIYSINIFRLRTILKKRNIRTRNQIDLILDQIKEELPKLKTSEPLLKPIYSVTTIVTPTILVIVKWLIDKDTDGVYLVILLLLLTIMVASLYYMIKPLLEDLLDLEFNKMTKLKQMIEDIRIIDDLSDKQSKIKENLIQDFKNPT